MTSHHRVSPQAVLVPRALRQPSKPEPVRVESIAGPAMALEFEL